MRFSRDNSLTLVLLLFFALSILGHALTGWRVETAEALRHGQGGGTLMEYLGSAPFLSTVFENWESEFLQMAAYVVLTAFLIQKGSSESRDPEAPPRDADLAAQARKPGAPAPLRWGAFSRAVYARSLGLALILLFVFSFLVHWTQSARAAGEEALQHGEASKGALAYLADPQLWFESFQNWQSEFLSTAVLVVLSIFLRQRESPESKPVAASHDQTGD
ncbi:DUF6766 family protein [Brevundimonas sp.]|uniref:DUF6766 family protein n=1 Tax=Brevundimonas sp. TaxID=1871086 RepID=UPI0028AC0E6E|nr:DUF6766 family protein [Brevundimonas sp.]